MLSNTMHSSSPKTLSLGVCVCLVYLLTGPRRIAQKSVRLPNFRWYWANLQAYGCITLPNRISSSFALCCTCRSALLERMPVKEPEEPLERYSDEEGGDDGVCMHDGIIVCNRCTVIDLGCILMLLMCRLSEGFAAVALAFAQERQRLVAQPPARQGMTHWRSRALVSASHFPCSLRQSPAPASGGMDLLDLLGGDINPAPSQVHTFVDTVWLKGVRRPAFSVQDFDFGGNLCAVHVHQHGYVYAFRRQWLRRRAVAISSTCWAAFLPVYAYTCSRDLRVITHDRPPTVAYVCL